MTELKLSEPTRQAILDAGRLPHSRFAARRAVVDCRNSEVSLKCGRMKSFEASRSLVVSLAPAHAHRRTPRCSFGHARKNRLFATLFFRRFRAGWCHDNAPRTEVGRGQPSSFASQSPARIHSKEASLIWLRSTPNFRKKYTRKYTPELSHSITWCVACWKPCCFA